MSRLQKNQFLEKHKKSIAKKYGFKSWNELRLNRSDRDCFIFLHEAAIGAIQELTNKP